MRTQPASDQVRREELLKALQRLRNGESPAHALERLSQRLTNKLLHAPTKALA
jgi:glutamyl-tRNA reductase